MPARSAPLDFADVARAVQLVLGEDRHFSHVTAAMIWDCPVPLRFRQRNGRRLHVTTVGDGPVVRRADVVGHRVRADDADVTRRRGLRTSVPERFWYECRLLFTVQELVVLGDHLIGRSGLTSIKGLGAVIRAGDRGVVAARAALELIRPGSESPMETVIRLVVVDAGFPEPSLNVDVHDRDGRFIGRPDLAWFDLRIAIEYDGDHHRSDRSTFVDDRRRGNEFSSAGWFVLHLTSRDAVHPATFLEHLRLAFMRAAR